jgi:hypothetical protein
MLWVIKTQFVIAFRGAAERWVLNTGEDGWTKDERGIQQVDSCPWRWPLNTGHKEGTY